MVYILQTHDTRVKRKTTFPWLFHPRTSNTWNCCRYMTRP